MKTGIAASMVLMGMLAGCITPLPLPTEEESRKVILATKWFQEPKTVRLATGELPSGATTIDDLRSDQVYRVMKELDLIDIKPGKNQTIVVTLTDRGQEASRQWEWQKSTDTNGTRTWDVWQVPVANKKIVQMLRPASGVPGTATVEFVWKWEPNPLGEKLVMQGEPVRTSTSFKKDERGWRIVS